MNGSQEASMELPRAVKEAEERANALIQAQGKQREGTPEETTPPAPEPEPGPEVTVTPTPSEPPQPEPEPPAQSVQPDGSTSSPPKPPEEDYEAKYKVLKGKYDKEVPDLASQVTFLIKKVGALEAALAEKETTQPTQAQEPAPAPAPEPAKDLSADPKVKYFQTEYPDIYEGTDILVQARAKEIARTLFKGEFDKLNQRLNAVEQGHVQKTKESFYEALNKAHPNWEQIQASPEFSEFIQLPDEFSGIPRWQLLKDAYNKLDAGRAIRFFDAFLNKTGSPASPTPSTTAPATPASTPPVTPAPSKVEARVAPPRSQNATPVPSPGGNGQAKVTPQDLKQFYLDVSQGKWKGREADMKKEEVRLIRGIRGG
jgi:hypothetical protein